jgi:hypothetical protein
MLTPTTFEGCTVDTWMCCRVAMQDTKVPGFVFPTQTRLRPPAETGSTPVRGRLWA